MSGYVIAEIVQRKLKGGIILTDGSKEDGMYSDVIVRAVHKDEKRVKVGDKIVVVPNAQVLKEGDSEDRIIKVDDICAIR